jgi:multidrug transporter EmrE-like cation transporter
MINLFLAIIFPVVSIVLLKLFVKYKVNNLHAIVVNYLGAAFISILLSQNSFSVSDVFNASWLYLSIIIGVLFIFNFYLIALAAQRISLSIATLANKISLVIPVLAAFMIFGEETSIVRIIGIILAFISIYLITFTNGKLNIDKKYVYLPILIFIATGVTDTLLNYTQSHFFTKPNEMAFFATTTFIFSFVFGMLFLLPKLKGLTIKNITAGTVLSIPNALGVYFVLKTLQGSIPTSIVFPVLNIGSLLLAVVLGYFLFKERLEKINWIGIGVAIVTIFILTI